MATTPENPSRNTHTLVRVLIVSAVFLFLLSVVSRRSDDADDSGSLEADYVSAFAMMGRVERQFTSPSFRGGEVTVVMGRGEVDLRQTRMAPEGAEFGVFVVMGRADVRVPQGWQVVDETIALMGRVYDRVPRAESPGPNVLHVKGFVLMGSASVRD